MTLINTEYARLTPVVQNISALHIGDFFQLPEDGSVYRLIYRTNGTPHVLCLDDLTMMTLSSDIVVEPVEINSIDVKVEIL